MKLDIKYPYINSASILADFCSAWDCRIISLSTKSPNAIIGIPWIKFKLIYGRNPRVGKWDIPAKSDYFINSAEILKIETKNDKN